MNKNIIILKTHHSHFEKFGENSLALSFTYSPNCTQSGISSDIIYDNLWKNNVFIRHIFPNGFGGHDYEDYLKVNVEFENICFPFEFSHSPRFKEEHKKETLKFDIIVGDDFLLAYKRAVLLCMENKKMDTFPVFLSRPLQEENLCFVMMPFSEAWSERIWSRFIKPTVESEGYVCERGDDVFSTNVIIEDVWSQIVRSSLIIADVTGNNPNVFYELGIAHTLGRKVLLIQQQNSQKCPFDVLHWRRVIYEDNADGYEILVKGIKKTIHNLKSELRSPTFVST